ncbi:hypothetical protein BMF94_2480 [Rhodotorula taiwanensis]|uniref:PH domain-containing protein n=1 Tax=Rhodotorula taiwanensis TaxID=741276 RepID=A0A2S5BCM1_9BASI|nr:hypothetical protein BMF94_2480 [Rhodotorula taiwanensis]
MVESPHPRSPTRSIRSDVVRSFTTSSETSASERIAASRAARALRRAPREADDSLAGETLEGEPSHATSTDALEGLATAEGTVTGGETATSSTSAVPRLRVQPTSDRSYSPSVPSSPAKSKKSTSASSHMSPTSLVRDDSSTEFPRAASTGNAASSGPSTPPPRSPSPSPPSSISLAGGLMERLKAQRAARAAQGAIAPDASDFSPTRAFETSSSRSMSVLGEDLMEAPAVLQATVTTFDNARPSSVPYEKLDMPPGSVAERPASLLERPSTLYGRVGEEIEFEFHQLSDVPEQTERSSLSTWQADKHSSWATSTAPVSPDKFPTRIKPFTRTEQSSSIEDDTSSASFRRNSALSSRSDRPDSFAQLASPTGATSTSPSADFLVDGPIRRLDATAHLTGRNASSASIFSAKSISSAASSTSERPASMLDHGSAVEGSQSGRSSPVRRLSPEVARRAALFGSVAAPMAPPAIDLHERRPTYHARCRTPTRGDPFSAPLEPVHPLPAPSHSSDEDLQEARPAPPAESGLSLLSRSSLARPAVPEKSGLRVGGGDSAIRCEGHLLLLGATEASPERRYCVLTDVGLDSRPTDQLPNVQRCTVLRLAECVRIDFEPAVSSDLLAFRPFALILRNGESRLFAADPPTDRLRWISAFRNLLSGRSPPFVARAESARSLTPPGSFFSETRGTVRSWPRAPAQVVPATTSRLPDRALVPSILPEIADGPGSHPSQVSPPPPLPPKPVQPPPVRATYLDRSDQFDRPSSFHDILTDENLASELRGLLAQLEVADLRKRGRHERYKRLRERLAALRGKLDTSPDVSTSARDADLAEKVDYLLAANERLLRNQELLQRSLGDRANALEANERELVRRVEDRLRDLIQSADRSSTLSPPLIRANEPDSWTVTTRRGGFSRSEQADWAADLRAFQHEAAEIGAVHSPLQGLSSVPSPTVVRKHREQASRKLEGIPSSSEPSRVPSASRLFGDEQVLAGPALAPATRDPFAGSGLVEPAARLPTSSTSQRSAHALTVLSFASSDVSRLEQTLSRILHSFEKQDGSLAQQRAHQERVSQVVGELARWVAEDRSIRDMQFQQLIQAVEGIVQHVSQLPTRLASAALDSPSAFSPPPRAPSVLSQTLQDLAATEGPYDDEPRVADGPTKQSKSGLLNPNSSFARAAEQATTRTTTRKDTTNTRGPRMPAFRLWGAPDPTGERAPHWGRPLPQKPTPDVEQTIETAAPGVVEALKSDEQLEQSLLAIARSAEGDMDPAAISMAVLEILSTMRDIARKQDAYEAKETAEKMGNTGLTDREAAELEVKRAEIARIEARTLMSEERTARINEMVAKLAERTEKADQLLKEIAQNVQEGKKTQIDPALSEEVKKLLTGVRAGVDDHVKDFRGQLTSEIQRMFKEVGKLRDEKVALQSDIAELLTFQAKHGGPSLSTSAAAPPFEVSIPPSLRPGMPTSGFFGPRAAG